GPGVARAVTATYPQYRFQARLYAPDPGVSPRRLPRRQGALAEEDTISQSTMRAAVLDAPGTALRTETIGKPEPKAGEVLLQVRACGVCATDLHVIKGE